MDGIIFLLVPVLIRLYIFADAVRGTMTVSFLFCCRHDRQCYTSMDRMVVMAGFT